MPSLQVIQRRGGAEEFAIATQYCRSPNNAVREVGANILAQLGYEEGGTFIDESVEVLLPMLNDESGEVVRAVAIALGRRHHESTIPHLLAMVDHPDGDVRFGVVHGLIEADEIRQDRALAEYGDLASRKLNASHVRDSAEVADRIVSAVATSLGGTRKRT